MFEPELARLYYKLLTSLDWSDDALIGGLREGLNKFLSNAWLKHFGSGIKYHKTHFVTAPALEQLRRREYGGLVFEHLVPKDRYIQKPCEARAAEGDLTTEFVESLLQRYWRLVTVTKAEDALLKRLEMPPDWDGHDVLKRYEAAGVTLVANPFFRDKHASR